MALTDSRIGWYLPDRRGSVTGNRVAQVADLLQGRQDGVRDGARGEGSARATSSRSRRAGLGRAAGGDVPRDEYRGVERSDWRTSAQDWFIGHLDDARVCIVVVEVGSRVVSTAMAAMRETVPSPSCPTGGDILISNVCTLPGARRQGHGQVAFAAVLEWAHSTGVPRAELMATSGGQAMYEAAGFAVTIYPAMRAPLSAAQD